MATKKDAGPDTGPEDLETATGRALVSASPALEVDATTMAALTRADLDVQIATAHAYPRSMARAIRAVIELATQDTPTATECIYSLPREGKLITGPSIRLAELIYQQWGNNRCEAIIIEVNYKEGYLEAQGTYHDLETNSATRSRIRRRIKNSRGQLYNLDMIMVTGNAACAIARRNAILGGIPKPIWRQAYEKCMNIVKGDERTHGARRTAMLGAMTALGLTSAQVFALAGVAGEQDITGEILVSIGGLYTAITNGEITVEELMKQASPTPATPRDLESAFGKAAAPEKPAEAPAAAPGPTAPAEPAPAAQPSAPAPEVADLLKETFPGDMAPPDVVVEPVAIALDHGGQTAWDRYHDGLITALTWADVKTAMATLRQRDAWAQAEPEEKSSADLMAFARASTIIVETGEAVSPASDPQFFVLWLDHAQIAPGGEREMLQRLIRSEGWGKLPEQHRQTLAGAVQKRENAHAGS